MTIRLKKRDDPDAFSKNQYKTLWIAKDGSYMSVNLLNGKEEYHKAKKRR